MGAAISLGFGLAVLAVVCVVTEWRERHRPPRGRYVSVRDIESALYRADGQVGDAFREARRAMNDAAGQSWRNLTD
jgi:hypothetical protein